MSLLPLFLRPAARFLGPFVAGRPAEAAATVLHRAGMLPRNRALRRLVRDDLLDAGGHDCIARLVVSVYKEIKRCTYYGWGIPWPESPTTPVAEPPATAAPEPAAAEPPPPTEAVPSPPSAAHSPAPLAQAHRSSAITIGHQRWIHSRALAVFRGRLHPLHRLHPYP
ncbi:uncharacterized protein [Aegilops tauschii subsp. strangulata]|nr:uncharacterized protein LOC120968167 isoform X1 [Aegilops tauschii subsp. strangulata]